MFTTKDPSFLALHFLAFAIYLLSICFYPLCLRLLSEFLTGESSRCYIESSLDLKSFIFSNFPFRLLLHTRKKRNFIAWLDLFSQRTGKKQRLPTSVDVTEESQMEKYAMCYWSWKVLLNANYCLNEFLNKRMHPLRFEFVSLSFRLQTAKESLTKKRIYQKNG